MGGAVGDLAVTVTGALASPFAKLDELGKLMRQSKSLGIDASQFQGLTQQFAKFGIEADMAATIFAKLGNTLVNGGDFDNPKAVETFARIGLNVKELAGIPIDQSFLRIASAIKQLPSAAEQANAAIGIFGKQGANLLPVLQKGGAGIEEFIAEQKKLGAVLSTEQLEAAASASKRWKAAKHEINSAWEGLVNRAAVIAAPIVEFAAKTVGKVFGMLAPVFDWVGRVMGQVGQVATAVFEQLSAWFAEAVAWFQDLGQELFGFMGEWPPVEKVVVEVFRGIGIAASLAWDTVKLGAGAIAFVSGIIVEQGLSILSTFRQLVDLLKGLPAEMKPTWLDGFVSAVDKADDKVKQLGGRLKNWGAEAMTSWGKSAQQFSGWLDKALAPKAKKAEAPVKLAAPVAAAPVAAVAPPLSWQPTRLAGAVEAGTKEAYSLSLKNRFGEFGPAENVQKENGKKQDKTNDMLKQIDKRLGGIEGAIEGV